MVVGSWAPRRCTMAETLTMISARVDDLPVRWAPLDRLGVRPRLDEYVPTPGHWGGLSWGWGRGRGLTSIRSAGDQRRHHVAPWATHRLHTRRECTGPPVHPVDVGDDRLATGLAAWRDERRGRAGAGALHQHAWRGYALQPACGRRDRTPASGDWSVTADGRGQCGHRQAHRPDRPQVTSLMSARDPLGLPVATDVGPGQRAEDPRDVPAIPRCGSAWGGAGGSRWATVRWPPWTRGRRSRREAMTTGARGRSASGHLGWGLVLARRWGRGSTP